MSTSPMSALSPDLAAAVGDLLAAAQDLERCLRAEHRVGPYDAGRADECRALAAEVARGVEAVASQLAAQARAADDGERERQARRGWEGLRGLFDAALGLARLAHAGGDEAHPVVERSLAASGVLLAELRARASERAAGSELELELRLLDSAREGAQSLIEPS